MNGDLDASYNAASELMRVHGKTFYFAARLLRPERRRSAYALYALFRTLDDLVDEGGDDATRTEAVRAALDDWRCWLRDPRACPRTEGMLEAVRDTIDRHCIPVSYFFELIDGLEMDLERSRYADFAELAFYCYRVASTVGLAMCRILGAADPAAEPYAAELGVAMQLTNIVRDVATDAQHGRDYVPAELARAANWDGRVGFGRPADERFRRVLRGLIEPARCYYARGLHGLAYLSPDARPAILVAAHCYAAILSRVESADYYVARRQRASDPMKLAIAIRCLAADRLARERRSTLPPLPRGCPDGVELLRWASTRRRGIGSTQPSP